MAAAYALGFLDCEDISARCMLTIFQFFATKTDASVLRMLNGSPADRLLKPITDYIESKGGKIHVRKGCRSASPKNLPFLPKLNKDIAGIVLFKGLSSYATPSQDSL